MLLYALFGLVILSTYSIEYALIEIQYTAIKEYFVCEAAGQDWNVIAQALITLAITG